MHPKYTASAYIETKKDPRWQAAFDEYVRDLDVGESADDGLLRRVEAAHTLAKIEREYESALT